MVHLVCAASCHRDCCSLALEWFNSVVFCFSTIGCDLLTWTREREVFMYGGSYYVTRKQSKHSMASECVWANHNQENITSGLFAGQPFALDIYIFLKVCQKDCEWIEVLPFSWNPGWARRASYRRWRRLETSWWPRFLATVQLKKHSGKSLNI